MLNINEVNNTITELENGDTTFASCQKLASLYIIRDNFKHAETKNEVEHELADILPQYKEYCNIKRRYQLKELTESAVITAMQGVCKEITEFIQMLYGSTDMPEERTMIHNMLVQLQTL